MATTTSLSSLQQQQQTGTAAAKPKDFPGMLKAFLPEIARALPRHLNPDRMARIALTCFRNNPKLGECDPKSVFAAVIQASQLGLEPGLTGEAHLVPYNKQCQLIPGYSGLIKLCMNSGLVLSIDTQVVYEKDKFSLVLGLETKLEHEPYLDGDRGRPRLVYGVARIKGSDIPVVDFMTQQQVYAIRDKSQGYQAAVKFKKDNPWKDPDQEPEMWRKTMVRRLTKRLPKSAELAVAMELDRIASEGKGQNINLEDAISGEYTVVDNEQGTEGPETNPAEAEQGQQTERQDSKQETGKMNPASKEFFKGIE